MKTSIKKEDKCKVKLTVNLDAEEIKAIVKDVEKAFVREAQLPGFRKGKIPLELIRKEFANGLKQEIQRAMFQKNYAEAVKAEKVDEVALANIEDVSYDENGGSFVATVEVKPEFKLPTYKGLKIESNDTTVKDFILDVTNDYAVEGVATDAGINIPRTDFKLVTRDGESLTAVTTVKAGKSAFICFTQKSPVVVDGTTYPCWCVIQLPFGDPS